MPPRVRERNTSAELVDAVCAMSPFLCALYGLGYDARGEAMPGDLTMPKTAEKLRHALSIPIRKPFPSNRTLPSLSRKRVRMRVAVAGAK